MNKEIERKFLINNIPDFVFNGRELEITQHYFYGLNEIRVRKMNDKYFYTEKTGSGIEREEFELEIEEGMYLYFINYSVHNTHINKTRYVLDSGIEVDIYKGDHEGLVVAEMEFKSLDEANNFEVPSWFGEEVTGEPEYSNRELALQKGRPIKK